MEQTRDVIFEFARPGWRGMTVTDTNGVQFEQITRGPKKGVFAGTLVNGKVSVGISLLSPAEPDYLFEPVEIKVKDKPKQVSKKIRNIDWNKAIELAVSRAKDPSKNINKKLNSWQLDQLEIFKKRCERYFKIV
jgi:hypothetical protein